MHRRVKKVERAFSLKSRRKVSLNDEIPLPQPRFEFEDALVTQLRGSDILSNCYDEHLAFDSGIGVDCTNNKSPKRAAVKRHPFHYDCNLLPLWQCFYNLDKKGTGTVLLGRLLTLTSLIGNLLNPKSLTENSIHKHFIGTSHVTFSNFKAFIERSLSQNTLHSIVDWRHVRSVCWSQCENWHLQALSFDMPDGSLPQQFSYCLFWLWCTFNQVAESDVYPPSADYEEVELLLRKLFSSLGIAWEESEDNLSSVSSISSSHSIGVQESSVSANESRSLSNGSNSRIIERESGLENEESSATEILQVTFQQFVSIIFDMLGSDTMLSHSFNRAVTQVYLSEVEEIIKTNSNMSSIRKSAVSACWKAIGLSEFVMGWMHYKKPGTDVWKKRWVVLRGRSLEFYTTQLCEQMKNKIVLNHNMHVESLPEISSHKYRFRLVEREGDFNITWEAEMSCVDSQHSYSWMLIINLSIKINPTGLSAKKIELAERRLERHRRRESELSAVEKRKEARKAREKLRDVRERWNIMQEKLRARAAARDRAMDLICKIDEVYDKLQSISRKQALVRKADRKLRNACPSVSSDSGVEIIKDENLYKSRDEKVLAQKDKLKVLEREKQKLQEELVELQTTANLATDSDKTLIFVYGSEKEMDYFGEVCQKERSASLYFPQPVTWSYQKTRTHSYNKSPFQNPGNVPSISISTSALAGITYSANTSSFHAFSQSHPELRNGSISLENGMFLKNDTSSVGSASVDVGNGRLV